MARIMPRSAWISRVDQSGRDRMVRIVFSVAKWGGLVLALAAIGFYAYETGKELANREANELRQQVATLTTQIEGAQRQRDEGQRALAAASGEVEALRAAEKHNLKRTK